MHTRTDDDGARHRVHSWTLRLLPPLILLLGGACASDGREPSWATHDSISYMGDHDVGLAAMLVRQGKSLGPVDVMFGVHRVGFDSLIVLPVRIRPDSSAGGAWGERTGYALVAQGVAIPLGQLVPSFIDSISAAIVVDSALYFWKASAEGDSMAIFAMRWRFRDHGIDSLRLGAMRPSLRSKGYRMLGGPMPDVDKIHFPAEGLSHDVSYDLSHEAHETVAPQLTPPQPGDALLTELFAVTRRSEPATTMTVGKQSIELEVTRILDLQRLTAGGAMWRGNEGQGTLAWSCYTIARSGGSQRVWFLARDVFNSIDEIRAEDLGRSVDPTPACPAWPSRLEPLAVGRGVRLGMTHAQLLGVLGEPSAASRDRLRYEFTGPRIFKACCVGELDKHDFEYDETSFLELRMAGGKVVALRAGTKTPN